MENNPKFRPDPMRIMDVDFGKSKIIVHAGKGGKDRVVPMPQKIREDLQHHINGVIALHASDLKEGFGEADIPLRALDDKVNGRRLEASVRMKFHHHGYPHRTLRWPCCV